jgi:hypothetical protein
MTISSFCRDQLLAHGPLPLQTLADLAAHAGKTTARDPAAAVRNAIAYKEIQLADDRWATPLWLLEGRVLTARRLPIVEGGTDHDLDDGYDGLRDAAPFLEDPDVADGIDGTRHDLALLDLAARSRPLALAAGGLLHSNRYGSGWRVPRGWPALRLGRDQLLGLRVREGQVHVELVPANDELYRAGHLLAGELGPLDAPRLYWSTEDSLVSDNLVIALWNRMAVDPTFLTSPVPPLSQCIPPLASALRTARDRRVAEASRWRPQLDLPVQLQAVAVRAARRSDQLLAEWLNAFASQTLHELDETEESEESMVGDGYGEVFPLQRLRWR